MKFNINTMLTKYKSTSLPIKASIWFIVSNVLQKGISMLTIPIFTRILNAEQYGQYSLFLSWLDIITVFTSLYLFAGVFNNAMFKYSDDRDKYISSMQGLTFTITFVTFTIYLIFQNFFNSIFELPKNFVLMMFIDALVTPALAFWSARQRFEYRYKALVTVTILKSIANPALGILLIYFSENKVWARIFSVVLVEVVVCGILMILQFIKGKNFYNKEYWKYALFFNIPLIPHYLANTVLNQADRVMINKIDGPSAAGIYSVAYSVGMLMRLVTDAVNSSFIPWLYSNIKAQNYALIRNTSNVLLVIISIPILILILFAPEAISLFAPLEYREAIYLIPPIATSIYFIFLYNLFINVEMYFGENKIIMVASIFAALSNIVLNWIFIPIFGYFAAGYTTLICYFLNSVIHNYYYKRVCLKNIQLNKLYNEKFIFMVSTIVVFSSISITFLYKYFIIRYLIIIMILSISYLKREILINKMRSLKKNEV